MFSDNIIESLKKIINNYETYSGIACSLEWKKCNMENFYIYCGGESGYNFQKVTFNEDIDFEKTADYIVQFFLQLAQYGEEWESDFWTKLSYEQKKSILENASELYKEYITFKNPCFKKMKFDEFEKDVVSWGANKVENFERGYDFIKEYKESEIVAFSGDFFPDEYWIGIDKRNMLLINFYCSG